MIFKQAAGPLFVCPYITLYNPSCVLKKQERRQGYIYGIKTIGMVNKNWRIVLFTIYSPESFFRFRVPARFASAF